MTTGVRSFIFAGAACAAVFIACALFLRAQAQDSATRSVLPASPVAPSSLNPASVQEKVSETVDGIISGDVSTAEKAEQFDNFLRRTFIRISDCMTLGRQEMTLAREYARQEAAQTAKDIFTKSVNAAAEQGREAILEKLPEFISPEQQDNDAGGK